MKPKLLVLPLMAVICLNANAQQQHSGQRYKDKDAKVNFTARKLNDLIWQRDSTSAAQYYIDHFNYFAQKSRKEVIALQKGAGTNGAIQLQNKNHKVVGNLNSQVNWDVALAEKALKYIDSGINQFPNRLDMRFGKIYLLGQMGNYQSYTEEIINSLDYGRQINHNWRWTNGSTLSNPEESFLAAEQDYIVELLNAGNGNNIYIEQLAKAVLKIYPNNVPNLSNLGITYLMNNQYDDALIPLLKANTIAPRDRIVLNNIAYCYELKNDKYNAIKYYKITAQHGSAEQKQAALAKVALLEKQ